MSMTPDFQSFAAQARSQGFDEVLVREWEPHLATPEHSHPFDVEALVVQGEFWLTMDGQTRHVKAGDTFKLTRDVMHQETYGAQGAVFWAARRHPHGASS